MKYTNICILVSQSHKIIEQSSNSILFSRYIYSLNMLFLSTQWTLFSTELDRGEGNKIVAHRHNIINIKWICLYPWDSRLARLLPCRYFLYITTSYLFKKKSYIWFIVPDIVSFSLRGAFVTICNSIKLTYTVTDNHLDNLLPPEIINVKNLPRWF